MKITGFEIGEYRQFKNIEFDFTYPQDHPKAGQPLDKVCFIGQSGTGKTTLISLMQGFLSHLIAVDNIILEFKNRQNILKDAVNISNIYTASFEQDGHSVVCHRQTGSVKGSGYDTLILSPSSFVQLFDNATISNQISKSIQSIRKICVFIKDSIAREADAFLFEQKDQPQTFSDFVKTDVQIEREKAIRDERINDAGSKRVISLGDMQSISTWQYLLKDINEYDEVAVARITSIVQNTPKNKVQEELQKWIDADPRHELAEKCLNPILGKFYLEIDTNAGNVPITLRTTGGVKIDASYLSTGTRQILATAIPLHKFDTTNTVILFDEPERSLFPDVQRELVKYYTSLAPEAQFFFATHSPIIASAFEPCERFILYFDENGEVKCRNGVAPIGDDPNDVLRQDFGMSPLMLDVGVEAYRKYLNLVTKIKNEPDKRRKMELIAERSALGNKYNFAVTVPDETN